MRRPDGAGLATGRLLRPEERRVRRALIGGARTRSESAAPLLPVGREGGSVPKRGESKSGGSGGDHPLLGPDGV